MLQIQVQIKHIMDLHAVVQISCNIHKYVNIVRMLPRNFYIIQKVHMHTHYIHPSLVLTLCIQNLVTITSVSDCLCGTTNRQTGRQPGRETDRQTDRQTYCTVVQYVCTTACTVVQAVV